MEPPGGEHGDGQFPVERALASASAIVPMGNLDLNEKMEFAFRPSNLPSGAQRTSCVGCCRICGLQNLKPHSILENLVVRHQLGVMRGSVKTPKLTPVDRRLWERWNASRRKPTLRQIGVDEIYLGKKQKFLNVVCNLRTDEPLWLGRERKKESLDEFFQTELSARQRRGVEAACVDIRKPYRLSIEQWAPNCRIIYDKLHIMQHADGAVMKCVGQSLSRKGRSMRAW
jgi:hypothetical protein